MENNIMKFTSIIPGDNPKKILIIGAGFMGSSLAKGIINCDLNLKVIVSDVDKTRLDYIEKSFNIETTMRNTEAIEKSDIIVLAVKPYIVDSVLEEIKDFCNKDQLIISIAAGIKISDIEAKLKKSPVIRAMPNICVQVKEGAIAFSKGTKTLEEHCLITEEILGSVGMTIQVEEKQLDAVTGLSGSGPAYIFMIIEALCDGGVRAGLSRDIATRLAIQTVLGSATMCKETTLHPEILKDMVTSPAGTTIEGVATLEKNGLRAALIEAVKIACDKSKELGQK